MPEKIETSADWGFRDPEICRLMTSVVETTVIKRIEEDKKLKDVETEMEARPKEAEIVIQVPQKSANDIIRESRLKKDKAKKRKIL